MNEPYYIISAVYKLLCGLEAEYLYREDEKLNNLIAECKKSIVDLDEYLENIEE